MKVKAFLLSACIGVYLRLIFSRRYTQMNADFSRFFTEN